MASNSQNCINYEWLQICLKNGGCGEEELIFFMQLEVAISSWWIVYAKIRPLDYLNS